jgi:hypothetical protein
MDIFNDYNLIVVGLYFARSTLDYIDEQNESIEGVKNNV